MKERQCRDCGIKFSTKEKTEGFFNQCDDCSIDDVPKYLGFNDGSLNKSSHVSIYRGDDKTIRNKIKNQKQSVLV